MKKKQRSGIVHSKGGPEERFSSSLANSGLSKKTISLFRGIIYEYYRKNARNNLPWRKTKDPYFILVSEYMLQQTQVERVVPKYEEFISLFPDLKSLSRAPLREVLTVWQGLGYNRRAMNLQKAAGLIIQKRRGMKIPDSIDELMTLPGVGKATASAVAAFAFHKPVVFIETNIRRVILHFFFRAALGVSDAELLPVVEATVDINDPRTWYYALMDYGAWLKNLSQNPNRRSRHYTLQTPFNGSDRQIRGEVLKLLTSHPGISEEKFLQKVNASAKRVRSQLKKLQNEGFIRKAGRTYLIA